MENKEKAFQDPKEKISKNDDQMDKVFDDITPLELQRLKSNLNFIDRIKQKPIPPGVVAPIIFGVKIIDINAILKNNIWNRSIFTVDKLCKMFLKADLEQKKKYLKKKRPMSFDLKWLLIIIIGIFMVLLIVTFVLPRLGGVF